MNEEILNYFGEKLMKEVRDETISSVDMMIEGKMNGITAKQMKEKISCLNDVQLEVVMWLIPKIVDLGLYNLLSMIEQNNDVKILINGIDIKESSDGLEGELYTEDGWIQKFSNERYEEI